jgi:hypothetical protein
MAGGAGPKNHVQKVEGLAGGMVGGMAGGITIKGASYLQR